MQPILICAAIVLIAAGMGFLFLNRVSVAKYEKDTYGTHVYESSLPVDSLCVSTEDVSWDGFQTTDSFHAAALFQLDEAKVVYASDIHERIYPASTTKIMTAYLAIKYGDLSEMITVSDQATLVPSDSSRAGLKSGDQLTLESLLYGMMLPSGNDCAVAVAEAISGSEAAFVELMNEEAKILGATNTHYVTPYGYQDEDHYTTAYDMYLIFHACIKYEKFLEVVSTPQITLNITQENGTYRTVTWKQTNQFINGTRTIPDHVTVIGGKTGTTDEAGSCLILYVQDEDGSPYISILMGADSKTILYDNMTNLISAIGS